MPQVLKYLLTSSQPMIEEHQLSELVNMTKLEWENKILNKYQFSLVTIPGMVSLPVAFSQ